jgi:hypothetical protein
MLLEGLVGGVIATQGGRLNDAGKAVFGDKYDSAKAVKNGLVNIISNSHGNIIQLVSDYAIEPIIVVTENAFTLPTDIFNNATNTLRDIFASYYIKAFNIIITNMGLSSVDAIKILGSNNRRGGSNMNTLLTIMESSEDNNIYNDKMVLTKDLSTIDKYDMRWLEGKKYLFSMEDVLPSNIAYPAEPSPMELTSAIDQARAQIERSKFVRRNAALNEKIDIKDDNRHEIVGGKKEENFKELNTGVIYKLGSRYLEFSINGLNRVEAKKVTDDKEEIKPNNTSYNIRIEVSGKVIRVSNNHLKAYITPKLDNNSFSERFKKWRAGVISFKNFIFANDLYKEYMTLKAKQPGPLNSINNLRQLSSIKSQMDYGVRGTQANYNMVMTTTEELRELCRFSNSVITRYDDKDSLLSKLNAIIILELDTANELAIFHISGNYTPSTITFKDLKKKSDNKIDDLAKFMEEFFKSNNRGGLI